MQNITRRQAAKAVAIGTATALIAPAALASTNLDAEILTAEIQAIEITERLHVANEVLKRIEKQVAAGLPQRPKQSKFTVAEWESQRSSFLLSEKDNTDEVNELLHGAYKRQIASALVWEEYIQAQEQAYAATGYAEKETRWNAIHDELWEVRYRIMDVTAQTIAGLSAQLQIIRGLRIDDGSEVPEKWVVTVAKSARAIAITG